MGKVSKERTCLRPANPIILTFIPAVYIVRQEERDAQKDEVLNEDGRSL